MFLIAKKDEIRNANHDIKNQDVPKIAGEMWRAISDEEKEKWRQEALKRAMDNGQNTNFEYLKNNAGNEKTRKRAQAIFEKINGKENPEDNPGYTSTLSD